jgi:hypothetical protein
MLISQAWITMAYWDSLTLNGLFGLFHLSVVEEEAPFVRNLQTFGDLHGVGH